MTVTGVETAGGCGGDRGSLPGSDAATRRNTGEKLSRTTKASRSEMSDYHGGRFGPCFWREPMIDNRYIVSVLVLSAAVSAFAKERTGSELLAAAEIRGGLIVQLGAVDGLTLGLAGQGRRVQVLDRPRADIASARGRINAKALAGEITVEPWAKSHLPYINNLVNVLILRDAEAPVAVSEIVRVLTPRGKLLVRGRLKTAPAGLDAQPLQGLQGWTMYVKPVPKEIDDWTHFLHSANNNAVANDTVIGSPDRLQWDGGPKWTRSHEKMSSLTAMVSARGRVFYIIDEGALSSPQLPPKWMLVARDAFNGIILWKREVPDWFTHLWPLKAGPSALPRRLVAVGDRVYVTLGLSAPVTALDAATGTTVRTYKGTEGTEEILWSDKILFLKVTEGFKPLVFKPENEHCWTESARAKRKIGAWAPATRGQVVAIDAASGKERWRHRAAVAPLTLTVDDKQVYFYDGADVAALGRADGKAVWRSEPAGRKPKTLPCNHLPTLVAHKDVVLFEQVGVGKISVFKRGDGTLLWSDRYIRSGHNSPNDLLIVNNLLWSAGMGKQAFVGKNIHTGKTEVEFRPPDMTWFHPRCHRSKATVKYLLTSRTGIEVVDVARRTVEVNHWTRGACVYGIMPANGLIYTGPHSCACLLESKTTGFNAFASPARVTGVDCGVSAKARLVRGRAYGNVPATPADGKATWPMYRHDMQRSGATAAIVPTKLKQGWKVPMASRSTGLTCAGGLVFTALPEHNTVRAIRASDGRTAWSFVAGGRVDSPPTAHEGTVIFGSRDGWVYCLRAADGVLAWKFLAAANERRLVSYGKVESVWPVHGSVLVMNGHAYVTAGRSAFLDGGIRVYKLDAASGAVLARHTIDDKDPKSDKTLQQLQAGWLGLTLPTANTDILSSNGKKIFMYSQPFDLDGKRITIAPRLKPDVQVGQDAHLFSPVGLLDDNWHHRSYWLYGVSGMYGWHYWFEAAKFTPYGRIMSFDDKTVYSFARKPQFLAQSPTIEYHLFKADKRPPDDGAARVKQVAKRRGKIRGQWNQTQWLSRGKLCTPEELTALKYHWIKPDLPIQVRAMVLTGGALFCAGIPDVVDEVNVWLNPNDKSLSKKLREQDRALAGELGARLWAVSPADGSILADYRLHAPPVFDGMIAIDGRLFVALQDGSIVSFE